MQQTEMITGGDFRRMVTGAYRTFLREYEGINCLNVFPVPDGDTGTNMMLTLGAVTRVLSEAPETAIGALSKRAADGAIMGARGNSGVILSQIFRGIARGLRGKDEATSSEIGKAFQYGVLYAYRAVARPVEGTILTVAKGIAKGARRAVRENRPFAEILGEAVAAGKVELARTPELLPALKSAGVVDAGGQGLIAFFAGCLDGMNGIDSAPEANFDQTLTVSGGQENIEISHPYCTEFVVKNCSQTLAAAKQFLEPLGESLVLAEGDNLLKVHIHTARPGVILESAITWGTLHDIKIDNMADQHQHRLLTPSRALIGTTAVISVAAGSGLTAMMQELGAVVVAGGDTMNPAVEDFVAAVHSGQAERYIILPNNKNVILAAAQTKKLLGDKVLVIPTTNIPQAFAVLTAFDAGQDAVANVAAMTKRLDSVKSASLTIAVRNSVIGERVVPAGRFIGLVDGKVVADAADMETALLELLQAVVVPDSEVVSLYYGADVREEEAVRLKTVLERHFGCQIELYSGGQPHYHFLISVE